ncbi:MAG TPA: ATP-binding protein, partial [Chloroflexota bacterium]
HARAQSVNVHLCGRDEGMQVTIKDDGVGFVTGAGAKGHFGLEIMSERAQSVGGRLDIQSEPGAGTSVAVWMPTGQSTQLTPDSVLSVDER